MRPEDAGLAHWVASDDAASERRTACEALAAAEVAEALRTHARSSLRQRAGAALIAFGERLAGDARPMPRPVARRRFAGQG